MKKLEIVFVMFVKVRDEVLGRLAIEDELRVSVYRRGIDGAVTGLV